MNSALIDKIEKAKRYAQEPDRVHFVSFVATIQGDNRDHVVRYDNGVFDMDDEFFKQHGYSAHTMAMERILGNMIDSPAKTDTGSHPVTGSAHIEKVEKAKRYAAEPHRFRFQNFVVQFRGDNREHTVRYDDGKFDMDEEFFKSYGYSAHTIALERILGDMILSPAQVEA